jgi:hypothetical protein
MQPMLSSYNANSALQATSQTVGNPLLERMARAYRGERNENLKFVRIGDFGCSGGRNSYEPMHGVITALANGAPIAAECILEDLPSNPWHQVMEEAPRITGAFDARVQVLCAGTSFYDRVCSEATIDLAYSYIAVHFLSASPPLTSHVLMHECAPAERPAWQAQAASDWEKFLLLRARELKKGGKMLLCTMSRDDDGYSWQQFSQLVWQSMKDATARGLLSKEEAAAMHIPACLRSESEIMAPFVAKSQVGSLFKVGSLQFARTEVAGERELPTDVLAPHIRRRVESVWGGMFLTQLRRFRPDGNDASAAMREVWDDFERRLAADTSQGWLDMRCFYLELTRR